MTCAEHLIENKIYGLKNYGFDRMKENRDLNAEYTYCSDDEAFDMAVHVVYTLYNGLFPEQLDDLIEVLEDHGIDWKSIILNKEM